MPSQRGDPPPRTYPLNLKATGGRGTILRDSIEEAQWPEPGPGSRASQQETAPRSWLCREGQGTSPLWVPSSSGTDSQLFGGLHKNQHPHPNSKQAQMLEHREGLLPVATSPLRASVSRSAPTSPVVQVKREGGTYSAQPGAARGRTLRGRQERVAEKRVGRRRPHRGGRTEGGRREA